MSLARAPLSLPLALAACFVDPGAGVTSPSPESSTAGPAATTTTDDTSASTSAAPPLTASGPETTHAEPTTGDPTADTTATTDATTTITEPNPATCGNGIVEGFEECDDGNSDNSDFCLSNCKLADCFDGILNQDEPDVDCGGPCGPCGPCGACFENLGCAAPLVCLDARCVENHNVAFDWELHCGEDTTNFVSVSTTHPGTWRITATGGGGRSSDTFGSYAWVAFCLGFDFGLMSTAYNYLSPEEAFAALPVTSVLSDYAGGQTVCGFYDYECSDNFGSSEFNLRLACE